MNLNDHALIDRNTVVFWFRRDLRLDDNAGLYRALKSGSPVVPIFIFDSVILDCLEEKNDARVHFIHDSVTVLAKKLHELGSTLLCFHGDPVEIFSSISPKAVFTNRDYEPYAADRDRHVAALLMSRGIEFHSYKDQVIFDRHEVVKDNGEPYTVFTPYSKKWKAKLSKFYLKSYPFEKYSNKLITSKPTYIPALREIGFSESAVLFPPRVARASTIAGYDKTRNFPGINGTTRLSVHLRFGTVSIRKLVKLAMSKNEVWLNELIWREFYQMILYHFPHVVAKAFKPQYDNIQWENDEEMFRKWCEGKTGYPLVDAGMRELNHTGFMHNRVRMVVASFLVKHLLIDWRWGEAYFAKKLLDYELASNNGGWQWAAGSGCDAAPYFRVFNPQLQQEKFDPDLTYCRKWIPELDSAEYPAPIVNHEKARDRSLRVYKKAVQR